MKKLSIIAFAIAAALSSTANAANGVESGTLQFEGNLTASSCTVDPSGSAATEGDNIFVDMGTVSFTDLGSQAENGVITNVSLLVECDQGEYGSVTMTFDPASGSGIDRNSSLLKLAPGGATGAAIAIYDADDELVDLTIKPEINVGLDISGTALIKLGAAYLLNGDPKKGGVANASLPFVVAYD
ncbi:TPA: type 1 fimbrial protein [Pseudomonas putida]|nr:type 1 fimbrial protein [Pseudomonas putida]